MMIFHRQAQYSALLLRRLGVRQHVHSCGLQHLAMQLLQQVVAHTRRPPPPPHHTIVSTPDRIVWLPWRPFVTLGATE